jgi:hypothetical protein
VFHQPTYYRTPDIDIRNRGGEYETETFSSYTWLTTIKRSPVDADPVVEAIVLRKQLLAKGFVPNFDGK